MIDEWVLSELSRCDELWNFSSFKLGDLENNNESLLIYNDRSTTFIGVYSF